MKRTPLKPGKPPERNKPIRKVNAKRKRKRYAEAFGAHADVIRGLPCCLCGAPPPSDPHHVKSRGAGGKRMDLAPLCRTCHNNAHSGHGPDRDSLARVAADLWGTYGE
jgi:5-methylcytosine-specific restriction endonuclease McrA